MAPERRGAGLRWVRCPCCGAARWSRCADRSSRPPPHVVEGRPLPLQQHLVSAALHAMGAASAKDEDEDDDDDEEEEEEEEEEGQQEQSENTEREEEGEEQEEGKDE